MLIPLWYEIRDSINRLFSYKEINLNWKCGSAFNLKKARMVGRGGGGRKHDFFLFILRMVDEKQESGL